jgi:dTDP-glucose 4,6-dehydratase
MRILVTGGAGFIGSHLCERFIADGHAVICVDNLITGASQNLAALGSDSRFTLLEHDISTPLDVTGPLDAVLHFASPASPADYLALPIPTLKAGAFGTLNALGIARAKRAAFLLASTSEVYGDPQVHPQSERYWGYVNPVGPRSVYDEAKRFAEALTMAYHHTHGLTTQIVRIFNTFGSRMRTNDGRAIPNFIVQALRQEPLTIYGDGSQTRSFCYIDDLVEAIVRLMAIRYAEPVNVGNPEEWTILEVARAVVDVTQSASPLGFGEGLQDDPKQRCPDITLATRLLGWSPRVPLRDGLRKTIPWFARALRTTTLGPKNSLLSSTP